MEKNLTDQILDIKVGDKTLKELVKLYAEGKLLEKSDAQSLPEIPQYFAHDISITLSVFDTYRMAQQDMLKVGFVKCLQERGKG